MADFLLILAAALVAAAVVFGVFAFALGRSPGLSEPVPDGVSEPLPDHPLSAEDLDRARFDVVLRGYRMDQVDTLVNRAASDLRQLQEYVDVLEGQLAEERRSGAERRAAPAEDALAEPDDRALVEADAQPDDRALAEADAQPAAHALTEPDAQPADRA